LDMTKTENIHETDGGSVTEALPKGFTYFVRDGDMIKIGSSVSPAARIKTLQCGFPRKLEVLAIVPMAVADEFQTHQRFAHLRTSGEWFRSGADLVEFIDALGGKPKKPAPSILLRLDCALRNERDATRRMQLALRMGMEREGSTPAFKARQDAILRPRYRVAAKMEVRL
jgi:hypothetical protein